MSAPTVTFEIAKRFSLLRRRLVATCIAIAVALAVTGMVVLWIALAAGDYAWEWPSAVRRAGLGVGLVAVFSWFVWHLGTALGGCRRRQLVGRLERSYEDFGQRVRTVLDAVEGRFTAPGEMLAALGHQTLGRWETLGPLRLVPKRTLAVASLSCLAALLSATGLFVFGDDWRIAMLRAVGSDLPYTRLAVTPGDVRLLEGAPVEVSLQLSGRTERDVTLRHRQVAEPQTPGEGAAPAAIPWTERALLPSPRRARFAADLGRATKPIEYQFVTSAGSTPIFRIDVQPLIKSQRIEAVVKPPEYTGLPSRTFASADVTVLEQSEVTVTIETNHPLSKVRLLVGEDSSNLEPAEASASGNLTHWSFELPTVAALHWRFSGEGHDGTPMTPIKGRLRVLRDRSPTLSWRDPPDEIRVHTLAELPMQVHVADDYGITESGIAFQLAGEEYVLSQWTSEDAADQSTSTTRLRLEENLPLESFGLTERDFVAYYAYAIDNRGGGPQRIETDIRYIDIRPLRQLFAEADADPNAGSGGVVLTQLDEIIRRQRFLINQSRKLVRSPRMESSAQLGRIDRMVENQSELASLTRFLAEFMVARGNDDVEALNQAEAAMLQAADSLAAGGFDLALVQEEDALRALAEARRSLEIVLRNNMSLAQQRALQQLARQLRQKLRRARPETEQEVVDTLQRLAADQTRLGRTAALLQRQKSSSDPSGETGSSSENADPPSFEEQQDELFAAQLDLLERLQAMEDQLSDRLEQSPLMAQRIGEAKRAMDELAEQARDGQLESLPSASEDAAEQIREVAMQLEALAPLEPVSRISAIRDMTTSLVNMESAFAEQMGSAVGEPSAEPSAPSSTAALERLARRMARRAETIQDVLKAPAEVGNLEASEVNANLERVVEEVGFLEQLDETRQAAAAPLERPREGISAAEQAYHRATEYAEAAHQLDELYRQLVAPRLARLQQMERQAGELAQQMTEASGGEETAEVKAGMGKLQNDLKEQGLHELAERLNPEYLPEEELAEYPTRQEMGPAGRFSPTDGNPTRQRIIRISKELQARIQEMILLEISADRDAPVPAQYRTAVDRYFRVIAGGADAEEDLGR